MLEIINKDEEFIKSINKSKIKSDLNNDNLIFDNLIWLTTKEAGLYLRRSSNAIRILVHRNILRARKFGNKLYLKKDELAYLLETSELRGGC